MVHSLQLCPLFVAKSARSNGGILKACNFEGKKLSLYSGVAFCLPCMQTNPGPERKPAHPIGGKSNAKHNGEHQGHIEETFDDSLLPDAAEIENYTLNLHYKRKLDTLGSSVSADLDWVKIRCRGEGYFYNYYEDLSSSQPVREDFLYTHTPSGYDIYSGKVDYAKVFGNNNKLEVGAKANKVASDNDSRFYFNNSGEKEPDPGRSNHFLHDETILAAYVNWNSKLSEKFNVQAGIRAENTSSKGECLTAGEINEREYIQLFPSLFL